MFLLILGVALWWAAHLFKRLAPDVRRGLGDSGKAMVAAALILSVLLMVIGYRAADATIWWAAGPALKGINNLLVLAAFYLFASSGMKNRIGRRMRHPQLIGFSLWSFAHLMVNGDLPSLVLFGGLLAWALVEIVVINRSKSWTPPPHQTEIRKEAMVAVAALVVFGLAAWVHALLGVNPFGA